MAERRRGRVTRAATRRPEDVYERYKDALRRGHVAALRGDLETALAAYGQASAIAPGRPMPRASAGLALLRAGRYAEAVSEFDVAVRLAPDDEATRGGRAEAFAAAGRPGDAALDLDAVADLRERGGRLAEALDAAARALELAEARHRRQLVRRLVAALDGSELDQPARAALAGALRVLDAGAPTRADGMPDGEVTSTPGPGPGLVDGVAGRAGAIEPIDVTALAAAAEAALDAGDIAAARARLLELSAGHRRGGHLDAALDACYVALSVAPDDADLHLALVDLYHERGWTVLATEKLDLLGRLATLDGDETTAVRVARARISGG